jgi:DNA polymerase III delta prime subunit
MMDGYRNLPLSEHLRPQELNELAISEKLITGLQAMVARGSISNMLFFGSPGTGKTSAARILCRPRRGYGVLDVDGSKDNGIGYIREQIEGFVTACALDGGSKIVFIDDGDYLTVKAQAALRGLIERSSHICRFIIAVNDFRMIERPIRSRLLSLNFSASEAELPDILKRIQDRVANRLRDLGWPFDRERLNQIVADNFYDLRIMANKIELEFG